MADSGIAIWESKYHYEFWRPVTGKTEGIAQGRKVAEYVFKKAFVRQRW